LDDDSAPERHANRKKGQKKRLFQGATGVPVDTIAQWVGTATEEHSRRSAQGVVQASLTVICE
jgi:hypothetical protein